MILDDELWFELVELWPSCNLKTGNYGIFSLFKDLFLLTYEPKISGIIRLAEFQVHVS